MNQSYNNLQNQTSTGVPGWACHLLKPIDLIRIEDAVKKAEGSTSGEIVPILVRSSTPTGTARRLLFMTLMFFFMVILILCVSEHSSTQAFILELLGGLALACFSFLGPLPQWLIRILVSQTDASHFVDVRAELEFHRAKIQHTKAKTGILLFISATEHRAVVLADQAISSILPPKTWNEVLELLISGIKEKTAADGIIEAVSKCGEILSNHFPIDPNDTNELNNKLIIKE